MSAAFLRFAFLAVLLTLALPFPAAGEGGTKGSVEESLSTALRLLDEGRPGDALAVLDDAERRFGDGGRRWEIEVLAEVSRQALHKGPAAPLAGRDVAASRRLKVAQVLLFEAETMAGVEENLRRLREAGVDTVFIRVFHNIGDRPLLRNGPGAGSGTYFRTAAAPLVADYLADIVPLCRRLGLSVYAWMTTRRCEWLLSERPDLAELALDPETGKVLPSRSLNIFHPRVRELLRRTFRDLAAYDIDGILFQDDLVMKTGEGFSPEAIAAFMEDGGGGVSPAALFRGDVIGKGRTLFSPGSYRPLFWEWAAWKNRALLDLARELMAEAREVRPRLRFALNLYYEAVINPRMALAWYGQSLEEAQRYPFDYFSLMSYHRQIGRELSLTGDEALDVLSAMSRRAVSAVGRPEMVIMKVQALDWETSRLLPREELDRALAAAAPVEGVSLAFVRSLSDPPLDVIRKHFGGEGR